MSLVNDLLIEIDRRNAETRSRRSKPFAGLSAPRRPARRRRGLSRSAFLATATAAIAIALIVGMPSLPPPDGDADPAGILLPEVSAARPIGTQRRLAEHASDEHRAPSRASGASEVGGATTSRDVSRWERPTTLRTVTIDREAALTRIRFGTDGPVNYAVEPRAGGQRIEVRIDSKMAPLAGGELDLSGTPIRSMRTRSHFDHTDFTLELDVPLELESHLEERGPGREIVIELAGARPQEHAAATSTRVFAASTTTAQSNATVSTEGPPMDGLLPSIGGLGAREAPLPLLASTSADFRIARSADDRRRFGAAEAERAARTAIREARFALSEKNQELALDRYQTALAILPGHRPAIAELAELLLELDRADEAISLVREQRRESPRESGLAMLQAKLLADSGELTAAIELLDQSGHSLTEAPDVHALAAAYLQRQGDHALAIERYETLLRRYPGQPRWWMGLGISLEAEARDPEALDVYRIALQLGELAPKTRRWISARIDALDAEG